MPATVIVNPEAGAGAARARWPTAARLLERRLGALEILFTKRPGHAEELARAAAGSGCELLIAAGGDGTLNEVVNGLLSTGVGCRLGVLPLASGGDLARTLGLRGLRHAVETLASGCTRGVDVLCVRCSAQLSDRCCLNEASVGLGAAVVADVHARWRSLPGRVRYMAAALRQLASHPGYDVRISFDGEAEQASSVTTIALANGRFQGGGMLIAPRASMTDGLLDVTLVERLSLLEALPHLHLLYTGGVYKHTKVRHRRAKRVRVDGAPQTPVELDGELAGVLPLEVEVVPGSLQLVAPKGGSL